MVMCVVNENRGPFLLTLHIAQILLSPIVTSLEPAKTPAARKSLRVIKKLSQNFKGVYKKGIVALVSHWSKAVEVN
jgi:hypothetical protein